jgi:hypothetical protein
MAAVARNRSLTLPIGERLLAAKLQILNGTGSRRPSMALSILTGAAEQPVGAENQVAPYAEKEQARERRFEARTVYLAESHLNDIDRIIDAWEQGGSRRLNRSAVLRKAVEHLRTLVETQSPHLLENE